ncbi:hypothetical protein JOC83_003983 [Bacillus iocasae]|uniref:Uncharacterized protein n=1 Tax=Priestia iocasae TaxID=2291674 RepID=A0ABS2R013_9BACI|nr:hypothetical protein [Metabacillus iocasae]
MSKGMLFVTELLSPHSEKNLFWSETYFKVPYSVFK